MKFNVSIFNNLKVIVNTIDIPFMIVRKFTIPPCDDNNYNHSWTILWPFFGFFFILWNFTPPQKWWVFCLILSFGFAWIFCVYKKRNEDEIPNYYYVINLIGILASFLWIRLCLRLIFDTIDFLNVAYEIPMILLGIFLVGFGFNFSEMFSFIVASKINQ